jgi:hypothetical protein
MKLLDRTQWVANPTPKRLATNRKRVLRSRPERAARSVDSECQSRVIESRKDRCRWSPRLRNARGQYRSAATGKAPRFGRDQRAGRRHDRVLWEPGNEPRSLGTKDRNRAQPVNKALALGQRAGPPRRAKPTSQTKAIGHNAGQAEWPVGGAVVVVASYYRRKQANGTCRSLGVGKGATWCWGRLGNRVGHTEALESVPVTALPRQQVSVTSTGRTACLNWARAGLWGCRRVTAGTTRLLTLPTLVSRFTCLWWTPSFGQENAEIKLGFQALLD